MSRLKDAVDVLMQRTNPEPGCPSGPEAVQTPAPVPSSLRSPDEATTDNFTAEGPTGGLHGSQDDSDLIPPAMNNLYSLTDPHNSRLMQVDPGDINGPDIVSRGLMPLDEAEFLFAHFRDHINPLLWEGMLCAHTTLEGARRSSSLLVAVVLSVAALHMPGRDRSLRVAYGAFVSLMRGSCLLRCQNLDVVRALCIGAFYLTSLSWALCSRAVRVATEMNIHKSSLQFARGSPSSYERVRLWYALYVCDHQFSLAYGRPPLMHEDAAVRNADKLLASGLSSRGDRGLVAQVKLFRILANNYFLYGCDPDLELGASDFEQLQSFNLSVDQWRLENRSSPSLSSNGSSSEGAVPARGNVLYYHLARFQMNSVSLRGISGRGGGGSGTRMHRDAPMAMEWDRQEAANNAVSAAMSTVRLVVGDAGLRDSLVGLPIFIHAMIAVCASFLLKMAVVFGEPLAPAGEAGGDDGGTLRLPTDLSRYGLDFHTGTALANVGDLVGALELVAAKASQRHVATQVVTGLRELLQRFSVAGGPSGDTYYIYSQPAAVRDHQQLVAETEGPGMGAQVDGMGFVSQQQHHGVDVLGSKGNGVANMVPDQVEYQPEVFDLTGDLDWRFDDGFLLGIDAIDAENAFL